MNTTPIKENKVRQKIKSELRSGKRDKQFNALNYLISLGTLNHNIEEYISYIVDMLGFTKHIEIKRMIYLLIALSFNKYNHLFMSHINTFITDLKHSSFFIRGSALKVITSVPKQLVSQISNHLKLSFSDPSPYVRQCAIAGVYKLWQTDPFGCINTGLLESCFHLLSDDSISVMSSVCKTIIHIQHNNHTGNTALSILINNTLKETFNGIIRNVNGTNTWPVTHLLDTIAYCYVHCIEPREDILNEHMKTMLTIKPLLLSGKPLIIISSIKVIVTFINTFCSIKSPIDDDLKLFIKNEYLGIIINPLMSIVTCKHSELQWIGLKSLQLVIVLNPELFNSCVSSLFIINRDKLYIKREKMNLLTQLINSKNGNILLAEFIQYVNEANTSLSEQAIHSISMVALFVPELIHNCMEQLLLFLDSGCTHKIEAAIVAAQGIYRTYPNTSITFIPKACNLLDVLKMGDSRAAIAWFMGDYSHTIDNIGFLLSTFSVNFQDETIKTQLTIINASIKILLKFKSTLNKDIEMLIQNIIHLASISSSHIVRQQSYYYSNLIKLDVQIASNIILKQPLLPFLHTNKFKPDSIIYQDMLSKFGNVSTVQSQCNFISDKDSHSHCIQVLPQTENSQTNMEQIGSNCINTCSNIAAYDNNQLSDQISISTDEATVNDMFISNMSQSVNEIATHLVITTDGTAHKELSLYIYMGWYLCNDTDTIQLITKYYLSNKSNHEYVIIDTIQINLNGYCITLADDTISEFHLYRGKGKIQIYDIAFNQTSSDSDTIQIAVQVQDLAVLFGVAPTIPFNFALKRISSYLDTGASAIDFIKAAIIEKQNCPKVITRDLNALKCTEEIMTKKNLESLNILLLEVSSTSPNNNIYSVFVCTRNDMIAYGDIEFYNKSVSKVEIYTKYPFISEPMVVYLMSALRL